MTEDKKNKMAEMKIIIQKIERIEPHDNADRLEIAFTDIFDWPVIIGKNNFKIGDKVKIREDSEFYSQNELIGNGRVRGMEIISCDEFIRYAFDNGKTISYRDKDLELIQDKFNNYNDVSKENKGAGTDSIDGERYKKSKE